MSEATVAPDTLHAVELQASDAKGAQRLAEARAHADLQRRARSGSRTCGSLRLALFATAIVLGV